MGGFTSVEEYGLVLGDGVKAKEDQVLVSGEVCEFWELKERKSHQEDAGVPVLEGSRVPVST